MSIRIVLATAVAITCVAVGQQASAEAVVRDHRGTTSNALRPMHLPPHRGGFAGLQGPDLGKGGPRRGAIIRDHR